MMSEGLVTYAKSINPRCTISYNPRIKLYTIEDMDGNMLDMLPGEAAIVARFIEAMK